MSHERTITIATAVASTADRIANTQAPDGSVIAGYDARSVRDEFDSLRTQYHGLCQELGAEALTAWEVFDQDMTAWQDAGYDTSPDFRATHARWKLSDDPDNLTPYLGPQRVPNGYRGKDFIATFSLMRPYVFQDKDYNDLVRDATAPVPQPRKVTIADAVIRSSAYTDGDGSVLFSELLATTLRNGPQTFGAFIINDFPRRHVEFMARQSFSPDIAKSLSSKQTFASLDDFRSAWLQVHDIYHDVGSLPHSQYLALKMKFGPAVLDELKADCSAFVALSSLGSLGQSVAQLNILDKMLRFPFSPYGFSSVDAAVGEIMLRASLQSGALYIKSDRLHVDPDGLYATLDAVRSDSLALEDTANTTGYPEACNSYLSERGIAVGSLRTIIRSVKDLL